VAEDWKKRTVPVDDARAKRSAPRPALHLVRVVGYDRPSAPGSRHSLDGLGEVTIGRGDGDAVARRGSSLDLRVADPRMSSRHARLIGTAGSWAVEDLGSTNGTFVDGTKVTRAELFDGMLIELGSTAFIVRAMVAGSAADVSADALPQALPGIRTFSPAFERELANLARLAPTQHSIVIHGETGTGKEVIARALHHASKRPGAFVAVNCGALPANLVESELFGHRKGAFSGATDDHPGLVRSADRGTLMLDEIGDLPLGTQAALLRVLQEREVMPVGATRPVAVDIRVLAASHRDLEAEVHAGRFREDLWSRLAGYTAEVPALRDRREDFGVLVASLLSRAGLANVHFTAEAALALLRYDWPRNVRELEQVLGSATALAGDAAVEVGHLPRMLQTPSAAPASRPSREQLSPADLARHDELRAALQKHQGNIAAVGRELGVARMQVHRWLERFGIDIDEYRR
jgi:transcriptional regulator with GAF, ATPase, and Fis domain